ncbi:MAG: flagellar biosynthesis anti-sigma factor FlgM [Planctomycetes bacterium]|nr:flagellar biosynthesis anti-sigma factor FlgM [Planctomycetota bacterium]
MNDISNIALRLLPTEAAHRQPFAGPVSPDQRALDAPGNNPLDSANFSELGQLLSAAADQPGVRHAKVAELRSLIKQNEDGFINARLGQTAQRVLEELGGE